MPPGKSGIVQRAAATALGIACLVAALTLPLPLPAQRKASVGPRALGVLVLPRASATKATSAKPYLIPVALWYQNRYFDAGLYGARPEPMALDGGVVYEARRNGEAVGLFTIDSVGQLEKRWYGGGQYRTMAEIEASAKVQRARAAPPTENVKDDGPPRLLRREGSETKNPPTPPAAAPSPAPAPTKPPASASASAPAPASAPPASAPPAAAREPAVVGDDDPDRPRLRRTPEGTTQAVAGAVKPGALGPLATPPASSGGPPGAPVTPPEVLVAISDAKGAPPRPYPFQWNQEEQTRLTRSALLKANTAIADYLSRQYHIAPPAPPAAAPAPRAAAPRKGTRPTPARTPAAPPEPAPLDNLQVRAFDLQYDNYPEIVLSGQRTVKVPGAYASETAGDERTVYVTLVVKVDLQTADPRSVYRTLLAYVTDDRHLDEFPLLTLLDAVDADGDGPGELLFSAVDSPGTLAFPQGWGFRLYRVGADKLEKVYDSAGKLE